MYMIYFVVQQKLTQHWLSSNLKEQNPRKVRSVLSQHQGPMITVLSKNCSFYTLKQPKKPHSDLGMSSEIWASAWQFVKGFPSGSAVKNLSTNQEAQETWFDPWVGKMPWRREWQPIPVFLAGESHGQRNLAGYSPWGRQESNTTEDTRWFLKAQRSGWNQIYTGGRNLQRKRQDFWKAANTLGMWTYLLNNWGLSRSSGSRTLWSFSGWAPAFAFCSAAAASCGVPRVLSESEQNQGSKSGETLAHLSLPSSLPLSRLSLETWPFKRHRKGQTGVGPDLADWTSISLLQHGSCLVSLSK